MKINEFTNKLGDLVNFTRDGRFIRIYANEWQINHNDYFLELDPKSDSLIYFEDWTKCKWLAFDRLCEVLNLVSELRHTPIDERFPENKYVLSAMRYVEGPIAIKQYVTGIDADGFYMAFNFGDKENAKKYTEKELRNLSQWFPREGIDAMKEPVEDE